MRCANTSGAALTAAADPDRVRRRIVHHERLEGGPKGTITAGRLRPPIAADHHRSRKVRTGRSSRACTVQRNDFSVMPTGHDLRHRVRGEAAHATAVCRRFLRATSEKSSVHLRRSVEAKDMLTMSSHPFANLSASSTSALFRWTKTRSRRSRSVQPPDTKHRRRDHRCSRQGPQRQQARRSPPSEWQSLRMTRHTPIGSSAVASRSRLPRRIGSGRRAVSPAPS